MIDLDRCPEVLGEIGAVCDVDYLPPNRDTLLKKIAEYDIFWGHVGLKVNRDILAAGKRLKLVATASTGRDHIDLETAERFGIHVMSLRDDPEILKRFTATAELAWLHLLGAVRNIRPATERVLEGGWRSESFIGRQLFGKTLGVLGVGRLGKMMARFGQAFRMRVLGCDLRPFDLPGVEQVDHDTLYRCADFVTIHVHLDEKNYHLVDKDAFSKMKDGVILINTSRGDVIDEEALLENLRNGKVAAAGLDVISDEWRSDMGTHPLVQYAKEHKNLVITPHIGGCTRDSLIEARRHTAQKIARFVQEGFSASDDLG